MTSIAFIVPLAHSINLLFETYRGKTMKNFGWTEQAELANGRLAMCAFVIAVGTYLTTGQLIPGIL
ncbi:HliP [Synechococcus phage B3]|nr:HliP [Synechococcus phage B3]QGT54968.1 HliP [Synechococcus phage B23]